MFGSWVLRAYDMNLKDANAQAIQECTKRITFLCWIMAWYGRAITIFRIRRRNSVFSTLVSSRKQSHLYMFNRTEEEERRYLDTITDKLDDAIDQVDENVSRYSKELQEHKTYLWENKTGMDAAEKGSMRESITSKAISGEAAVAMKERLRKLKRSPWFGRIDFREDRVDTDGSSGQSVSGAWESGGRESGGSGSGGSESGGSQTDGIGQRSESEPVYIGIHSFHDDKENRNLIHDWRAPISGMFYDYELGRAGYEAPSGPKTGEITCKRQYRIHEGEMEMMLESGMHIRDDILQEELSRAADDKMKNIVATIQRDQNAIIRNETSPVLVIQGVAGSGKTSIALHRIAFLLYRYKESLTARDLLIISPNKVFADYISNVLPELGEETIPEMGIEALAMELLEGRFTFQSFFEQVNRLLQKPDEAFIARIRFKANYDFLTRLNNYIGYLERENFAANDMQVRQSFVPARFVREKYLFYRHLPMFKRLTEVVRVVTEKVRRDFGYELKAAEKNKLRSDIRKMYRSTSIRELYRGFYDWLERPELFKYAAKTTFEYADVYPLIYLKMRLEGYGGYRRVKHLLVDEMQDYTPVQYAVLARLFPCNKTILGDARQSVNPYSSTTSEEILRVFTDAEAVKLVKSYRSTWEIARFAQRISADADLVAVERHGEEPRVLPFGSSAEEAAFVRSEIAAFRESPHRTMGIICKTQRQAEKLHGKLTGEWEDAAGGGGKAVGEKKAGDGATSGNGGVAGGRVSAVSGKPEIHLLSPGSAALSSGVNITTAHLAKGLEFDRVIVPQVTANNYATEIDKSMLYIACTRAMHRLSLSHTGSRSLLLQNT